MCALHQAALMGNLDMMQLLLDHAAAVDLKDNKGMSVTYLAFADFSHSGYNPNPVTDWVTVKSFIVTSALIYSMSTGKFNSSGL